MRRVEVFKTNIQDQGQAQKILDSLKEILPDSKISFDLEDPDKILRIENPPLDLSLSISVLEKLGFLYKIIPDKICEDTANSPEDMRRFWESSFDEYKAMWGLNATNSAIVANNIFKENNIKDILIPGIGYGRNAKLFIENGITVTGIEIAKSAIELARQHYGLNVKIFNGSVTDMPFDTHLYDGIFCHGLLYLLNLDQRKKMTRDCYNQLKPGGWMVFSVISKNSPNYGKGKKVAKDTFEIGKGGQIYFYDADTVKQEFQKYNLIDFFEIDEPNTAAANNSSSRFIIIKCKKEH